MFSIAIEINGRELPVLPATGNDTGEVVLEATALVIEELKILHASHKLILRGINFRFLDKQTINSYDTCVMTDVVVDFAEDPFGEFKCRDPKLDSPYEGQDV